MPAGTELGGTGGPGREAIHSVVQAATPGDLILTLGAGDVNNLIDDILTGLTQRNA